MKPLKMHFKQLKITVFISLYFILNDSFAFASLILILSFLEIYVDGSRVSTSDNNIVNESKNTNPNKAASTKLIESMKRNAKVDLS
jgi:hypothetical protein